MIQFSRRQWKDMNRPGGAYIPFDYPAELGAAHLPPINDYRRPATVKERAWAQKMIADECKRLDLIVVGVFVWNLARPLDYERYRQIEPHIAVQLVTSAFARAHETKPGITRPILWFQKGRFGQETTS